MAIISWYWKNEECIPFVFDWNDMDNDLGNVYDTSKKIKTIFKAGDIDGTWQEFDKLIKSYQDR